MEKQMKYSGYEWIGEIPEDWDLLDIDNVYIERNKKVNDTDYMPLSVTMKGIVPQLDSVVKTEDRSNRKMVCKDDFVINSRSDRRGAYGVSKYDGSCSVINIVLKPRNKRNSRFYSYALHSNYFPDEFYRWGSGIVADLWTTRWDSMRKIQLPCPPAADRERIASYLDEKCDCIDEIKKKTIDSIELYKSLKQAVITKAITNGIRKNRTVKYSGYSWYGDIPSDWRLLKLKRMFHIKKDIARREGLTVLSITQRGIIPKDISRNEGQMASDYSNYQLVEQGDFAMNHMDLLTGWVDISHFNGVTSPDYRVFCLNNSKVTSPEYFLYMLQMCYFNRIFYSLGQGVSEFGRWRLQADKFLEFDVLVPPYEEQCEIAKYLKQKVSEIDLLVQKKEAYIENLDLLRKSMIYEYTTGKKEVPAEWVSK